MVQKKNVKKATAPKTVAVVEKVEEKACTCGCNCNCGSGSKGVVGDDYSAVASNPAGMTLKETGAQVGTTAIFLRAEVE